MINGFREVPMAFYGTLSPHPTDMIYLAYYNPSQLVRPVVPEVMETSLGSLEKVEYSRFKIEKRRVEWLTSRWVAKKIINHVPEWQTRNLDTIQICKKISGQPFICLDGCETGSFSLSHSHAAVFCGFSPRGDMPLGCDLEWIESRSSEFLQDYFTPFELNWITNDPDPDVASTLTWSAKEAVLKAYHIGLSIDTQKIEIQKTTENNNYPGWHACRISLEGKSIEQIVLWQAMDGFVKTLCIPSTQVVKLNEITYS